MLSLSCPFFSGNISYILTNLQLTVSVPESKGSFPTSPAPQLQQSTQPTYDLQKVQKDEYTLGVALSNDSRDQCINTLGVILGKPFKPHNSTVSRQLFLLVKNGRHGCLES